MIDNLHVEINLLSVRELEELLAGIEIYREDNGNTSSMFEMEEYARRLLMRKTRKTKKLPK